MPHLWTRIKDLKLRVKHGEGEPDAPNRLFTVMLQWPTREQLNMLHRQYRYKFRHGPRQDDQVIYYIWMEIDELNRDHIRVANLNFRAVNTDDAPPIWSLNWNAPTMDMKMYTFMDDINEFPATVWVSVIPRRAPLSTDRIYVQINRKWIPLKDWLVSLAAQDHLQGYLKSSRGLNAQRKWWRLNRKVFKIMDLPAELRMTIFEHVLGPQIHPLSTVSRYKHNFNTARITFGFGYNRDMFRDHNVSHLFIPRCVATTEETRPPIPEPNLSILRLSKQTHKEALKAGWESTRKFFVDSDQFSAVVDTGITPSYNWIAKVQLNFTTTDYFEFFGVSVNPVLLLDPSSSKGQYISRLTTLQDLQIRFRKPSDGWEGSPWGHMVHKRKIEDSGCTYTACQRTVVDWVLTFAFPFIKHLPTVTLNGAVKKSSKVKWKYILTQEYMYTKHGQKTSHGHNQTEELEAILNTHDMYL